MLTILYLASIFIQLTSIYFWCALFIVFLIICSEFKDAFVLWFPTQEEIFTLKTWLFIGEVQTWNSSVCYGIIIFLKSIRHWLKVNNNKTLKNLRLWDSEGLKSDGFWIFTEISKYEQLYLLFTSIRISVFMLVCKSPRYFLRKYIVLCTHIIVIKCYSFSKIEKNSKKLFFHFTPFSASPYCTKALLICLENSFSHNIPSIIHVSRSRDIKTSLFCSYRDLNFEKSSETPQF